MALIDTRSFPYTPPPLLSCFAMKASHLSLSAVFASAWLVFSTEAGAAPCGRWFAASTTPAEGVAIVAHGMNNRPEVMDDLVRTLTSRGLDVLRAGFSGHCGDRQEFLDLTTERLKQDALSFYGEASNRAAELKKPLYLVAYSFSATVYELLRDRTSFDRRIFFAPALATHWWYPVARLLGFLPSWFPMPSVVPPEYRANAATGSASIRVIAEFLTEWESSSRAVPSAPEPPTLVFIHPGDELVSRSGVERMVADRGLKTWSVVPVENSGATHPRPQAHRIIDEVSVGKTQWIALCERMNAFLAHPR